MKNFTVPAVTVFIRLLAPWLATASLATTALGALAAPPKNALSAEAAALAEKADASVSKALAAQPKAEFLVMLGDEPDLTAAANIADRVARIQYVVDTLKQRATDTQAPLRAWLAAQGVEHRSFWVANMIYVNADASVARSLAARDEVKRLVANPRANTLPAQSKLRPPQNVTESQKSLSTPSATTAVEWGVAQINAPQLWALGITGQGIVIAGQDTGYDWTHPALKSKYRGWNGATADHNYHWHDAIHPGSVSGGTGGVCGFNSMAPCDDQIHGTHTMGTMVGDDGSGNQIGVAPGAKWIGCRNMDEGNGTPATYAECFQWFLQPTDLSGNNGNVAMAPHVINNSWGCPVSEGCDTPAHISPLKLALEAVNAAGILVVASAGNSGFACSTVQDPPSMYDAAFGVGATDSSDSLAGFSSRGPVTVDGSGRAKPDVSAPGVGVRSSIPGPSYINLQGTSMAGPHVAGAAALLMQAYPSLIGKPTEIRRLLMRTAKRLPSTQNCGALSTTVPNNSTGWGRIDVLAAYNGGPGATLDIDGNTAGNRYDAATDGVLIARHLLGLTSAALTHNALAASATRNTLPLVKNQLDTLMPALDIDGDGQRLFATDGLLILRYLLGMRGTALTTGIATMAGAQRTSAADIEAYLALLTP